MVLTQAVLLGLVPLFDENSPRSSGQGDLFAA